LASDPITKRVNPLTHMGYMGILIIQKKKKKKKETKEKENLA
jgi:hypothetical protein